MRRTLARHGMTPEQLVLEITETVPVVDLADAAAQITRLNAMGIKVALDDFGAGYNSLTYLHALPVQIIKLDRGLAVGPEPDRDRDAVSLGHPTVRGAGPGGHRRGHRVDRTGRHGVAAGCRLAQGHLFGRAVPIAELSALASLIRPHLRAILRATRSACISHARGERDYVRAVSSPSRPVTQLDKPDVLSGLFAVLGRDRRGSSATCLRTRGAEPTSLPGWNVHDVVAHVIGTESMLQGVATPEADIDVSTLKHVRNDIGVLNERWVRKLRGLSHASCSTASARRRPSAARR